ncbi:MAG: hypothetical protein GF331_20565 [Chitinivibrionales bacterium]|nr:hypothetical protein [Chitinivibrionales bacterium]
MIPVDLTRTMLLNLGNDFVVLLRSAEDKRALPISIGQFEAQAIAIKLNSLEVPRPLTHDLLKAVVEKLECSLVRVEVCDLRDETFYARLILKRSGDEFEMDSRPSDAIALALRFKVPVFVADEVMEQAGVLFTEEDMDERKAAAESEESSPTEPPSPMQLLQRRLDRAIADERYEEAAEIRDQIKKMSSSN